MMVADTEAAKRATPSDIAQVPVVWRYELLRHLRSWRLIASVAISVVMLALLFLLPQALGSSYSGTDTRVGVWVASPEDLGFTPGPYSPAGIGLLNRSEIDTSTIIIYVDRVPYPSDGGLNWSTVKISYQGMGVYAVLFNHSLAGQSVTASYDWYTSPESFASIFLNFSSYLVIISASFFGADALVGEFQSRTGYLMFPNPVRRTVIFSGKFAASMTASIIVITVFYVGMMGLSAIVANGIDDDIPLSFAFAVEYLAAVTAIAYLLSSLLKGATGSIVLTFLLFIIILPIVDSISIFTGVKINASLTFSAGVIPTILMDPYPTDWSQELYAGFTYNVFYPEPATAALVMFAYAAIAIAISLIMFKRKQLAG